MRHSIIVSLFLSLAVLLGGLIAAAAGAERAAPISGEAPRPGPALAGGGSLSLSGTCPTVQVSSLCTIVYGSVTLNGVPAPSGSVVEARSPRGDVTGCFVVKSAGIYGAMYVYGEDINVSPPVPGMQSGETIAFYVEEGLAASTPSLTWTNDCLSGSPHEIALAATSPSGGTNTPTPTPSSTPTATPTNTATTTPTETPTSTPTETPTYPPTATETPTSTPTDTSTYTPTPTDTPTGTPTDTPTWTPTSTSTPRTRPPAPPRPLHRLRQPTQPRRSRPPPPRAVQARRAARQRAPVYQIRHPPGEHIFHWSCATVDRGQALI